MFLFPKCMVWLNTCAHVWNCHNIKYVQLFSRVVCMSPTKYLEVFQHLQIPLCVHNCFAYICNCCIIPVCIWLRKELTAVAEWTHQRFFCVLKCDLPCIACLPDDTLAARVTGVSLLKICDALASITTCFQKPRVFMHPALWHTWNLFIVFMAFVKPYSFGRVLTKGIYIWEKY